MSFEVIPAIDVSGGGLARFTQDGPVPLEAFGGDPLVAAESFAEAGARWLHVVDMDLAFSGQARNLPVVESVASLGIDVQASGGVARAEDVNAMLEAGATRVVLGSGGLTHRPFVESLIGELGERLIVGLEVEGDRIRARGGSAVDLPLDETLSWLAGTRAARYLLTDVGRVGTLGGAGPDGVRAAVGGMPVPVLVSGGVSTEDDLRALIELGPPVEGAVIGRALVEGELSLSRLLTVATERSS